MSVQIETTRTPAAAAKPAIAVSPCVLTTRTGFAFLVRPASPEDEPALAECFAHVTPAELRFRFLTGCREVGHHRLEAMTVIDHDTTENFLALLPDGTILASGLIATDAARERAEVAISIRADYRGRGISWTLLDHIARYAQQRGIKVIESIESRENRDAIALEQQMGFIVEPLAGDPTLVRVSRQL
ncbi:GNAT family N-acetyltransferase [Polymorphobacter sp.]|uniref:GNAT family N-acetyltransferase n=1 Tax=Polymorphobacter sp. TaxID=1909290 RepID=UPI003F726F29